MFRVRSCSGLSRLVGTPWRDMSLVSAWALDQPGRREPGPVSHGRLRRPRPAQQNLIAASRSPLWPAVSARNASVVGSAVWIEQRGAEGERGTREGGALRRPGGEREEQRRGGARPARYSGATAPLGYAHLTRNGDRWYWAGLGPARPAVAIPSQGTGAGNCRRRRPPARCRWPPVSRSRPGTTC